jgi:hypothetical protein
MKITPSCGCLASALLSVAKETIAHESILVVTGRIEMLHPARAISYEYRAYVPVICMKAQKHLQRSMSIARASASQSQSCMHCWLLAGRNNNIIIQIKRHNKRYKLHISIAKLNEEKHILVLSLRSRWPLPPLGSVGRLGLRLVVV